MQRGGDLAAHLYRAELPAASKLNAALEVAALSLSQDDEAGLKWLETPDQAVVWGTALGLEHEVESVLKRHRVLRLPIIRGVVALGQSLVIGFKALGISVIQHLPGVGENLQDHIETYVQHACTQPITLYSAQNLLAMGAIGLEWLLLRSGLGATNHFEAGGFIRSQIPRFRLPEEVIDEETGYILDLGVTFKSGERIESMTALLGLLAVAGYQNRDKLAEVLSGVPGPNPDLFCILLGSTAPLSDARLSELYAGPADYLQRYDAAADALAAPLGIQLLDATPGSDAAAFVAGGVVVAINPTYPPNEILNPLNDAGIEVELGSGVAAAPR